MRRLSLLLVAIGACRADTPDPARDLTRALEQEAPPADTASTRRRDELARCKFVYHDEQGLRECLVVKYGWEPAEAGRAIAVYIDSLQRRVDSLRRRRDSAVAAELAIRRQRYAHAARQPYWGVVRTKTYFANTPNCDTLPLLSLSGLRYFQSVEEAGRAGYSRTDKPGC